MKNTLAQLTNKEVINTCDGTILGYITDLEIDTCSGRISSIILPGEKGAFGFKKSTDVIIPWERICRIGNDTILVDIGVLPIPESNCKGNEKKKS